TLVPSDRLVQFNTSLGSRGSDAISFPRGGQLTLIHTGPAAAIALTLSAFAADGQPVAVTLPSMRLAPGTTLRVAPTNWRTLGSSPIRITLSAHGRSTTRTLRGIRWGHRFATIRRASLHALGRGRYAASVSLQVSHAPAGSWLSIAATVLKGRRPIATTKPAQVLGARLKSSAVRLALGKTLPKGRYRLRIRVLETTVRGAIQGSVVVTRTIAART
ncbi:MAG: hypothetical protein ACYC0H_23230, partial [Solirubrobacteraceae bacterium]